jgi:hypothetical protein
MFRCQWHARELRAALEHLLRLGSWVEESAQGVAGEDQEG